MKQEVNGLKERVESLEEFSDDHEQYFRRNCLLIHWIEEDKDEVTDDMVATCCRTSWNMRFRKKTLTEVIGLESRVQERKGQ